MKVQQAALSRARADQSWCALDQCSVLAREGLASGGERKH
jgi:hypothetical protein